MSDKSFRDYIVHDVLIDIDGISSKNMFGGYGIYRHGVIFAMIAFGRLYFKVGEANRADYEELGSTQFIYKTKGKDMKINYWELPEEIMENKENLSEWIEKSLAVHKEKRP